MIEFGCLARFFNKYSDEVKFAQDNGFNFMQLWYDKDGLSLKMDNEPLEEIKKHNFPTIIHAVLDINEIQPHITKLIKILNYLGHKELIIHPICNSEGITNKTIYKLSEEVRKANFLLSKEGIKLHLENNSRLDPIFCEASEIEILFNENPEVEFLLDIAHVDDYAHLEKMIHIKQPKILHVADRNLDVTHEHLAIGKGNIDYKYIFSKVLTDFKGKIIFEIVQDEKDIVNSRNRIKEMLL